MRQWTRRTGVTGAGRAIVPPAVGLCFLALSGATALADEGGVLGNQARDVEQIASLHLDIKAAEAGYAAGIPITPPR